MQHMAYIDELADRVRAAGRSGAEAVDVLVVTPDEGIARTVAPMLARRLYPDRIFGAVLHMEWAGAEGGWHAAVADRGPKEGETIS
jgi:hypothetical protein